jgi:signal transduction histidine kinase
LDIYKQDLYELLFGVLQQRAQDLSVRGINVRRELPDEACLVFGEDLPLRQVMHIIVDNIIEHSMASKLLVEALVDVEKSRVQLGFFDNGKGFRLPVKLGEGFRRARRILSAYSASINLKFTNELHSKYSGAGFRAGIIVHLMFLPTRRRVK